MSFTSEVNVTAPNTTSSPAINLSDSDLKSLTMTLYSTTQSGVIALNGSGDLDIQTTAGDIILTSGSGLINAGSSQIKSVADPTVDQDAATKKYVDDGGTLETSNLTLVASGTIVTSKIIAHQVIVVQGNAAGTVTLSATPFQVDPAKAGQLITLIGNSATNLIQIDNNDASSGCIMNASWVGGLYDSITFAYSSTQDRYVEIARNN